MMAIVLFLAAGRDVELTSVLVPLYPALVAVMAAASAAAPAADVGLFPVVVGVALGVLELHAVKISPDISRTAPMRINAPLWVMWTSSPVPRLPVPPARRRHPSWGWR